MWTISNGLSLLRGLLTLPAAWFLWNGHNLVALWIGVFAYITDLLDGWVARKLNEVSEAGKIIDPLSDKVFVGVIVAILVIQAKLPLWFVLAILSRDVIIMLAGVYITRKTGFVLPSNYPGKATVLCISFTMICVVADLSPMLVSVGMVLSTALMVISLALYTKRFVETLQGAPTQ